MMFNPLTKNLSLKLGKGMKKAVAALALFTTKSVANSEHGISIGLKYLSVSEWVYYAVLLASVLNVLVLSPVKDRNKPLDEIEHKVYKKRTVFIAAAELAVCFVFKPVRLDNLFLAMVYSFAVLSFMLIAGKVKNKFFNP